MIEKLQLSEKKNVWKNIVQQTAESFRLNDKEKNVLKKSRIAQLIGALPYLAKCNQAERTSLSHLSIYIIAMKGSRDAFFHNPNDNNNILKRLDSINHFDGGDKKIIEKGMKLLALNMVHDYKRDIEEDKINNKYNPISFGVWNYKEIVTQLVKEINAIDCPLMDNYFTAADTPFMYWR